MCVFGLHFQTSKRSEREILITEERQAIVKEEKKCFKLINRFLFNIDDDDNVIRRLIKTFFNCCLLLEYESSLFLAGVCYIQSS